MSDAKCNSIRVELSDGRVLTASGKEADAIWSWYLSCEQLAGIHGARFAGKGYTVIPSPADDPGGDASVRKNWKVAARVTVDVNDCADEEEAMRRVLLCLKAAQLRSVKPMKMDEVVTESARCLETIYQP
jgi:hypothetical protein